MTIDQDGIFSIFKHVTPLHYSPVHVLHHPFVFITRVSPKVPKTLSHSKIFGKIEKNTSPPTPNHTSQSFGNLKNLLFFGTNFWELVEML